MIHQDGQLSVSFLFSLIFQTNMKVLLVKGKQMEEKLKNIHLKNP